MTEEAMTLPSKQEKQLQSLPGKQILNGFRNFKLILQSQRDHCCSDKTEKEHKRTHKVSRLPKLTQKEKHTSYVTHAHKPTTESVKQSFEHDPSLSQPSSPFPSR